MSRQIKNGSYEDWVTHVFDHPVGERDWYWADDADDWDEDAATTAEFIGRIFRESSRLPEAFSDRQISIGLNYIVNNSCSNHFLSVLDSKVPWEIRREALSAIRNVFSDLFAARCNERLSHIDEPGAGELNGICYMWWDIAPVAGEPEDPMFADRDALLLKVMSDTLALDSEACREGALHGLGHWHAYYPEQVEKIIHEFIGKNRKVRDPLRAYAYAAMRGGVL
jgi:hypothetical protein